MPKDPKSPSSRTNRHNPLHEDLADATIVKPRNTERHKKRRDRNHSNPSSENYVDSKLSRKILQIAREQQDELDEESRPIHGKPNAFLTPQDPKDGEWE